MNDFNIQPDSTYFIDTNIWLYSFIQSQNKEKTEIAKTIIKECETRDMAIEEMGHSATEVARHLEIKQTSVLQSVKKGKILCGGLGLQA